MKFVYPFLLSLLFSTLFSSQVDAVCDCTVSSTDNDYDFTPLTGLQQIWYTDIENNAVSSPSITREQYRFDLYFCEDVATTDCTGSPNQDGPVQQWRDRFPDFADTCIRSIASNGCPTLSVRERGNYPYSVATNKGETPVLTYNSGDDGTLSEVVMVCNATNGRGAPFLADIVNDVFVFVWASDQACPQ